MNNNEKIVIVPWNGEGWTTVGDSDQRERDYIGFVLPNEYDGKDGPVHQVLGQWNEDDIARWAKGFLDSTGKELPPNSSAETMIARYRALIHELSIIIFDNVVKSRIPKDGEIEQWKKRGEGASQKA